MAEEFTFTSDAGAASDAAGMVAPPPPPRPWALVGVLASGNLEVLVEPLGNGGDASRACEVRVETSAHGFGEVWAAVVAEFFDQHRGDAGLAGLRFTVHDAGATPAVVALRLEQAWREFSQP